MGHSRQDLGRRGRDINRWVIEELKSGREIFCEPKAARVSRSQQWRATEDQVITKVCVQILEETSYEDGINPELGKQRRIDSQWKHVTEGGKEG